jgi:cytochrome c5
MSEQATHESFIKTPQQLIVVVLLAFVVPIFGIVMLVQLVVNRPQADPAAQKPESVAARIQPVGTVEFGEPPAPPGARSGEEVVKAVCVACHGKPGIPGAPKMGDSAEWAKLAKSGLAKMVAVAIKGTDKGMPPKGGAVDLTDTEIARSIVYMVNQSGGSMKEPAEPAKATAKPAAEKKK